MIQALLLSALLGPQTPRPSATTPTTAPTTQESGDSPLDPRPLLRFRAQRLQEGLGLSAAQADAIAQRWASFDQEHFQRQRQITALRLRFNDILMGPESEDRKSTLIKPLLEQFMGLRDQQLETKRHFEDDIRKDLSPAQQARLVLLVEDLNKRVVEALHERRKDRRGF